LLLSERQAKQLKVKSRTQISEHLEKCCLLISANNSYERTAEDLAMLTGIYIPHSTQQRLVHRQVFEAVVADEVVDTISIDGGKVRIRTPKGQESVWNDYKAVTLGDQAVGGYFKQNQALVDWVNQQPLAPTLACLGDGHDGIWNLFKQIGTTVMRLEILDWFHLMENLHKVELSSPLKRQLETRLWQGQVEDVIRQLQKQPSESGRKFVEYLVKHQSRLPNYQQLQAQGVTIGSGAVESAVKQIGRRIKISGAQWQAKNVDQVVQHRAAYLNGCFTQSISRKAS
jgi:hypothetical protein